MSQGISAVRRRLALACVAFVFALPSVAHHSQSEFDFTQKVEVEGKISKLEWKSPHARLYVDVVNGKGDTENWNFELPRPNTLMRRGWTRESLKAGDVVKVSGARARNFPTIAYATVIRDAKGQALFTGTTQIHEPEPVAK